MVRNDPTGTAIFLTSVLCFCRKVVTFRMDCVLVGTSIRRMTLTGSVVRDPNGPTTQFLPLDTVVMAVIEFSKTRLTNFGVHKRTILVSPRHSLITFTGCK